MKYSQSYTNLRIYTEKWSWVDPVSGIRTTGYVHPQTAREVQRVPFYLKAVTKTGHIVEGNCVCLSVDVSRHQRKVQFIDSKQIRVINDILVISVDGIRFITH